MPDSSGSRRRMMVHGLTPAKAKPDARAGASQGSTPPPPFLVGHGYDIHRLEPGSHKKLTLAGVVVAQDISVIAHSDGDVIIHAIVDAIFGALGHGDIGESFSPDDPLLKDAASRTFLEEALTRVRTSGYVLTNIDVTLLLEKPKILPHKPAMIASLRKIIDPMTRLNIKAGTNEGVGAVGRGEAVVCHAVVLLAAEA